MNERAVRARILANALEAYCVAHSLARWRVCVLLFKGCRSGIAKLRASKNPRPATLERVREFISGPPPLGLHRRPLGGKRVRRDNSTGAWLASKVDALIAEHGLSPRIVSLRLFNSPHGLRRLREQKPQRRTVERIQAFLERPDIASLKPPPVRKLEPRPAFIAPLRSRPRLTFQEQLALVEAGKAQVVPKLTIHRRDPEMTLGGVTDWGSM
jgi:hypothetical protein